MKFFVKNFVMLSCGYATSLQCKVHTLMKRLGDQKISWLGFTRQPVLTLRAKTWTLKGVFGLQSIKMHEPTGTMTHGRQTSQRCLKQHV